MRGKPKRDPGGGNGVDSFRTADGLNTGRITNGVTPIVERGKSRVPIPPERGVKHQGGGEKKVNRIHRVKEGELRRKKRAVRKESPRPLLRTDTKLRRKANRGEGSAKRTNVQEDQRKRRGTRFPTEIRQVRLPGGRSETRGLKIGKWPTVTFGREGTDLVGR